VKVTGNKSVKEIFFAHIFVKSGSIYVKLRSKSAVVVRRPFLEGRFRCWCCTPPVCASVRPSVRPSIPCHRLSLNRKAVETSNLVYSIHHPVTMDQFWGLKVKGHGHWERKYN